MTVIETLKSLILAPRLAYREIEQHGRAWFPLLLLMLGNALIVIWYFQVVDIAWLRDYLVQNSPELGLPEQRKFLESAVNRSTLIGTSLVSLCVSVPLFTAVVALYFSVVGKTLALEQRFGQWFAFAAWTSAPAIALVPVMALRLLLRDSNHIAQDSLNPLSLNQLLLHAGPDSVWKPLFEQIELSQVFSIALATIGLALWSGRGRMQCLMLVLLPYVVIYGLWAWRIVATSE